MTRLNLATLCALTALSFAPLVSHAAPPTWLPTQSSETALSKVEELKAIYLECDRASMRMVLDATSAGMCSVAAEELRVTGFDGRFEDLYAWWRSARTPTVAAAKLR